MLHSSACAQGCQVTKRRDQRSLNRDYLDVVGRRVGHKQIFVCLFVCLWHRNQRFPKRAMLSYDCDFPKTWKLEKQYEIS